MADGLFSGPANSAAVVSALMQKEREDRIRKAGEGMDPIVAAVARANQGMRESIGDIAGGIGGMFGGVQRMDPRMQVAMKRDKDRQEMIAMLQRFASDDDGITEEEARIAYGELIKRGYMAEAKAFLEQARTMGSMRRAEAAEKRAEAGEKRAEAGELRAEKGLTLREREAERAQDLLKIRQKELTIRERQDARQQIASEIAQKKAQAEREMDPLRKQKLEEDIKFLQERRAQLGKDKVTTTQIASLPKDFKKIAKNYMLKNYRKEYSSKYKDDLREFGPLGGDIDRNKIDLFYQDLSKLRTDSRYKNKTMNELIDILFNKQVSTGKILNQVPVIKR